MRIAYDSPFANPIRRMAAPVGQATPQIRPNIPIPAPTPEPAFFPSQQASMFFRQNPYAGGGIGAFFNNYGGGFGGQMFQPQMFQPQMFQPQMMPQQFNPYGRGFGGQMFQQFNPYGRGFGGQMFQPQIMPQQFNPYGGGFGGQMFQPQMMPQQFNPYGGGFGFNRPQPRQQIETASYVADAGYEPELPTMPQTASNVAYAGEPIPATSPVRAPQGSDGNLYNAQGNMIGAYRGAGTGQAGGIF